MVSEQAALPAFLWASGPRWLQTARLTVGHIPVLVLLAVPKAVPVARYLGSSEHFLLSHSLISSHLMDFGFNPAFMGRRREEIIVFIALGCKW